MGINPTPTVDVCCNHFVNPVIAKALHSAAVGTGFIPVLPTADKIQSKYPAAARVEINPTPTVDVCCKCFIISVLQRNQGWLVGFVTIDNAATFVRLVSPSTVTP